MMAALNFQFLAVVSLFLIIPICLNHLALGFQTPLATALPTQNETDKLALLAFKDKILEDPFGFMSSWNESLHFCNWRGVSCSYQHEGKVTNLNLAGQKLVGSIPPYIGNLSFLRQINLSHNYFQGEIPQEIGHLFRLRLLNLSSNVLQGKIPSSLAFCLRLQDIDFSENSLIGEIPVELRNLSKSVRIISFFANQLIGSIPQWLGNASSLEVLALRSNNIHGSIPTELGRLPKLDILMLSANNSSGKVPVSIFNISSLSMLSLAENQLQGTIPSNIFITLPNLWLAFACYNFFHGELPISLQNASMLKIFSFGNNNLSGVIPSNLGSLKNLVGLTLTRNHLESEGLGILTSLANCTNLRVLDIGDNHLKGELPLSIANLSTNLGYLSITKNQISGKIPEGIDNLVGLTFLHLLQNHLTGEVPSGIGKLKRLSFLSLGENRISGPIPSSLGNITQLLVLDLARNNLSGTIPLTLGNCSQLEKLYLDENYLIGDVPKQLLSLSPFIILYLGKNFFIGQLPLEVGNMTNLVEFDVSNNKFSGKIPSTLGNCLMLEVLKMQENVLEGDIPFSLSSLKSLEDLDLSRNNLSGQIPKFFQNFTFLQNLNLSFNGLEGEVPQQGVFKNASVICIVGNQKLCGGIQKLGLPSCKAQGLKKKVLSKTFKIVIPIIVFSSSIVIAFLFFCCWKRRYKMRASTMMLKLEQFPKISYAELSQATNEFSPSNLIGEGSFGSVYNGMLGEDQMQVAVKVLNLKKKGASESFIAECEVLRNIRHRNLVQIITVCSSIDFKQTDFKALVYKLMKNGSLEEWLHPNEGQAGEHTLNLIQRINIAIEVAFAIEYLHDHCQPSIIHGDLKPSNVLLDENLVAHVGDFGLARSLSISCQQSSSIGVKGTIGYIAPEYSLSNRTSKLGDVYSFGILLLEMITGKRPIDSLFQDNFTIHQFVKTALLPQRVMDILEPLLLQEVQDDAHLGARNWGTKVGILESLVAVAKVGVLCSMASPNERMEMKDVIAELCAIKDKFVVVESISHKLVP
ncbi:hypothetical protein SLEP1_g9650 [Rubroshorea leprosula]|uniref:non-specific serine/threonine protein kinase n=1 Tax=Rubroshorea leprosula TaxID=152421 RepID=A0AAV5IFH4_9ROSI|nr:hypothetical protein SLEP1_g9650 [Rubroshorea leprosula]